MPNNTYSESPPSGSPRRSADWPATTREFCRVLNLYVSDAPCRLPVAGLSILTHGGRGHRRLRVEGQARFALVAGQSGLRRDKPDGGLIGEYEAIRLCRETLSLRYLRIAQAPS